MARVEQARVAFNRGLISRLGIARVDLKRMAFASEIQVNWMSRSLGSMMLRPGLEHLGSTASNLRPKYVPFVFATDDTALLEFTNATMRVWVDDALVTRVAVSTAVANGTFDTNLTSWTDNDEAGATSAWVTGGYMGLTGTGTLAAIRDQTVVVAAADQGVEHALRIVVERGPVIIRAGTSTSDDSYINEIELATGVHSITFQPTGNFNIRFMSRLERQVLVNSCTIEAAGVLSLPSPYVTADLRKIRWDQSGDVVFLAATGYQQRRIERRSTTSWSLVLYLANDGPFRTQNLGPVTLTGSALSGNITVTASAPLFRSGHVGALFNLVSTGQRVEELDIAAQNTFSDAIRITGVDSSRVFTIIRANLSGTGTTVTLQRSLESDAGPWEDVTTYTTDATITFDDGLDNQIAWYRIGVKTGGYVAGLIDLTLDYALGSITGIVRLTAFSSSTSVSAEVLTSLGGTSATDDWAEGRWSDYRGWPSTVSFNEGRLTWHGKDRSNLSISDAFDSFDAEFEGDAGPIDRSIGSGPVDSIMWSLPLQRLVLGGQGAEYSCRSTAFDEPLTPTNFNIKPCSTQGSAEVAAVKIDSSGMFVQRGGTRLFELAFNSDVYDYGSTDVTLLVPEIGRPSIVAIAVQRQPDTRIHCVRSDGTAAVLIYDKLENVQCWLEVETDGDIEDVVVLPSQAATEEDQVYYAVARTINGSTVRYLEKWAMESGCSGGQTIYEGTSSATISDLPYADGTLVTVRNAAGTFIENVTVSGGAITLSAAVTYAAISPAFYKLADSFIEFTNVPASTTVTGLTHLVGESVVVYQDGICPDEDGEPKTYTVSGGGTITLDTAARRGIVGLPYEAPWMSAKLGDALAKLGRVDHLGLILIDTHAKGLKFGPSLTESEMNALPLRVNGKIVDADVVHATFDDQPIEFPSSWSTNPRVCLLAKAPRPAAVLGAVVSGEFNA